MRKHLSGGSLGKHRTFVHYDDTVAAIGQVIHAVRNHDNGQALAMESIDELQEITARRRIEPRHGFIEHQDFGLHGEYAGECHTPLLTARKLKGTLVADRGKVEAHARERCLNAAGNLGLRQAKVVRTKRHVLRHGFGKQLTLGILKHHADLGLNRGGVFLV